VKSIPQVSTTLGFVGLEMVTSGQQVIHDRHHPLPHSSRAWGTPDRWSPGTPAIVARALFGILQNGVGLIEAPEAGLGVDIVRVQIRMEARGQSMIGLLDLLRTRLPANAEDVIIIRLPQG
jgi:hypothetical protein